MKFESKYEIGDRVWVVYEAYGEACVYDDYIDEICVNENKEIYYILKEVCMDIAEENLIPYEDTETLINKIKEITENGRRKNNE